MATKQKRIPTLYHCPFINEPITVNGVLDEPAWQRAKVLDFFIPGTLAEPISKTGARMLYDDRCLYVGFMAWDKDITALITERDGQTCSDDVLEIFFKPEPAQDPYYNFEINALGTVYDAMNIKRGASGNMRRWSRWNCPNLLVGITIKGTLNDWTDVDEYWCMEVAIPFASLPTIHGRPPRKGDRWSFHLSRYDYSVYLPEGRELMSCAPLSKADFHYYEDWMTLEFN